MRVRRNTLALLAVVAFVISIGIVPAAAKIPRITGDIRCTISNGSMTFNPGLRYRDHIEGTQKGRGPSATGFTADLSGCTNASNGPAPAGIDHGTLQATGKVSGSYCEKLDRLKVTTDVVWARADNFVVGRTVVKLAVDVATPGFNDPWTLAFAGRAKGSSTVFPKQPISFSLDTTSPNWAISGACFKLSLDSLALANGTFAADPPA
jgi:hypothetical protein